MPEILHQSFEAVTQWPVIVQGALGSALFALISYIGQLLVKRLVVTLAQFNQNLREENLHRELIHTKHILNSEFTDRVMLVSVFQASNYVVSGLIFLGLGWLFDGIVPLSFKIGVLGFLYFTFRAILWLERFNVVSKKTDLQIWSRVKEIETELFGKPENDTLEKLNELQRGKV
jgi:hypothetical protein